MFEGDILQAFDHMRPHFVTEAMLEANIHPQIIVALMADNADKMLLPKFSGVRPCEQIPLTKCEQKQGSPDSGFK